MISTRQLVSVSILETCVGLRHVSFKAGVEHFCHQFAHDLGVPGMEVVLLRQRVLAEQRASDRRAGTASLGEIYREIRLVSEWGIDADTMKAAEERFHLEQAVCHERAREVLETLRDQASSILFLASTPLSAAAIRDLLIRFELLGPHDEVCVAHDNGTDFDTPEGFRRLLENRPTPAAKWTHYGDGRLSERRAVETVGGTYHAFFDATPNRYETPDPHEDPRRRPFTSAIMAIQRNTRMATGGCQTDVLNRIFANVVAPLLTSYIQEVIIDARGRGLETLYFMGGGGKILRMIAEELPHDGLALRHLHGDRQAWLPPSAADRPEEAHAWMTLGGPPASPRDILKRAEIQPEEIESLLRDYHLKGKEDTELRGGDVAAMNSLLREPAVIELIAKKARERRKTMLAYLDREGLAGSTPWALVDIGWSGHNQRAIRTILLASGYTGIVQGYYLGLNQDHVDFSESGPAFAYAINDDSLPTRHPIRTLFRYRGLIEEVFTMADHGSTRSYEQTGGVPRHHLRMLVAQQSICTQFARLWARSDMTGTHNSMLKYHALRNLAKFFNEPEIEEVQAVRWLKVGSDQNEPGKLPIAKPYSFVDCVRIFKRRALQYHAHSHSRWREGSIAISPSSIRTCITAAGKFHSLWHHRRTRTPRVPALA